MLFEHNSVTFTDAFQCLNISSRLQFFVNTLAEERQRADDVNIVEYCDGKSELNKNLN